MLDTWQTITSFLTPATLFLLLNLVIATIVLSSRRHHDNDQPDTTGTSFAGAYHFPLLRTTSPVLERLRSMTLHRFRSGEIPADPFNSSPRSIPIPSINPISTESEPKPTIENGTVHFGEVTTIPSPSPSPSPRPLERTSSILDYIKSINLYRFRSGEIKTEEVGTEITSTVTTGTSTEHHYERSHSESSRPIEKKKKVKKPVSMRDAGSEEMDVRQRSFRRRDVVVEEGVDARADDFINRFKEQLKIQRLNSILNYKEMLNRGK